MSGTILTWPGRGPQKEATGGARSASGAIAGLPAFDPGWVWLAGGGPGDPGLLTLHALNALNQADHVVHDALVSEDVLALVRSGAEIEYAGKRGGKPSAKQRDISSRLIELARQDKRVLRLKGGDPFVFGRGGEEALSLVAAGIPFRIIPGVTAGVGGLAYAGIPATHRDTNHAITFVTGHMAGGDLPEHLDWEGLAKGSPALVLYMALSHLKEIVSRLRAGGRPAGEPVAIVSNATLANQRVIESTLGSVVKDAEEQGAETPCLIVVGEIVRLRSGLDWLGALQGDALEADPLGRRSLEDVS